MASLAIANFNSTPPRQVEEGDFSITRTYDWAVAGGASSAGDVLSMAKAAQGDYVVDGWIKAKSLAGTNTVCSVGIPGAATAIMAAKTMVEGQIIRFDALMPYQIPIVANAEGPLTKDIIITRSAGTGSASEAITLHLNMVTQKRGL